MRKEEEGNFLILKGYEALMTVVFKYFSAFVIVLLTSSFQILFIFSEGPLLFY